MAVVDLPAAEHESLGRAATEACCGASRGAIERVVSEGGGWSGARRGGSLGW